MNILITGASGFIGRHLHKYLLSNDHYAITVDRDGKSSIQADLANPHHINRLPEPSGVDVVYHLAARSRVMDCECDQVGAYRDNVEATKTIAERYGHRVVFTDSYVSDSTIYGQTKHQAAELVRRAGGKVCILANVYGPGGRGVIDRWLYTVDSCQAPTFFHADSTFDFVHVDDVVKGLIDGDGYIGTGEGITIRKLMGMFNVAGCLRRDMIEITPPHAETNPVIQPTGKAPLRVVEYIRGRSLDALQSIRCFP